MIELQIDKTKGGYKTFTRTRISRYALEEMRGRGGDIRDMIPEYNRHSSMSIIPDEASLDYFVELEEEYYILTAYTRSPKTRLDNWITDRGITLCFHEGGTHWHEGRRDRSLYINTFPDNSPKGNISILLPAHTCEEIKEAVEKYNSRTRHEYAGANLHYERSLGSDDENILTRELDRERRRREKDEQYIPDFLFTIE